MRLKKLAATVLVGTMVITSLVGCGNKTEEKKVSEINLTYVKAPLNVPSIIQKNDDLFGKEFKEDNITVNFHEITAGPDQTAALAAGELDFLHALGGTSALIAASNGVELEILNTYSRSPKGFMIVANDKAITSAKDLVGKKVAGPKGTILHQVLIAALQAEGHSINDVEFIQMSIPDAAAALADGSIDAALTAGPNALTAINSGSHVVATGEGLVDGIIVTAVSKKFADENPELVERFVKVEKETLQYVKDNNEEAMEKVAKEVGLTVDQVKEMYTWYDFSLDITDADIKALEDTQEFLLANGLQENKVDINSLLYKK
ncbi:MAG: NrtA/SsuA/CpmA family ABC transporter substrate-binding protein [bacterium]|nr:NrtA/SsuA/CpmA family ABC transporter substrate-binding protein [bacterium]